MFLTHYAIYYQFFNCYYKKDSGECTHLQNAAKYSTSFFKYAMYAFWESYKTPTVRVFWYLGQGPYSSLIDRFPT